MVVFDPAGDSKGVRGFLGDHTQNLDPAFERTLHVLSMRIMGWDFDGTNQPFTFD
jgi:hypothetical protein